MKERIKVFTDRVLPELWQMSRAMYDNPELGLEEKEASKLLRDWLAGQGFSVSENFHKMPTAFKAVYGSGRPVLGFLCEYDALPEIGHACGHNLIGVVSAGAAAALKEAVDEKGGTLVVFGTPDEENTCTKVQMTNEGAFDDIDVMFTLHPGDSNYSRVGGTGNYPIQFEFFGRQCHASQAGPDCINALDAAVMAYLNINQTKQYLDANIYGVFENGGLLPNIIPDYACLRYYIRCDEDWKTKLAVERITRCVQGVADSMNVELKVSQHLCPIRPLLMNETLLGVYEQNMHALGEACTASLKFSVSTDAGDVSYRVPTLHG
ncbi:amidohydrolase, partial [Ruminococcaceae bacterium OttesenSCG-928-A11]|nr:amidohydrolase [Ruminococcaceae bacterium OttesenSCG-928-A11]